MRRPSLSYANVMSTVGVFIALGGTSYAVTKLPKDSVGSRELKRGAVATDDLADGAVTKEKLASGAVGSGARGPRGEQGPAGPAGANGATGPSDVIVKTQDPSVYFPSPAGASVEVLATTLPAGRWSVIATLNAVNNETVGAEAIQTVRCNLYFDGEAYKLGPAVRVGDAYGATQVTLVGTVDRPNATTAAKVACTHDAALPSPSGPDILRVERARLLATRTGSITVAP